MYFKYQEYLKNQKTYQALLDGLEEEITQFLSCFHDDPRIISAWGHHYFCNEDGGRLIYDRKRPYEHVCSICKKIYQGYLYDTAYITMLRNEAVVTAVKAALLYQVRREERYLDTVKDLIEFYASHYHQFAVHAKSMIDCDPAIDVGGAGKIMPQGLNEAIIAIRLINALELVKESLDEEWLLSLKERLFGPIYELLLPQKMHIHNIPTWINSAIGVMGFFFQEEVWIRETAEHPYNLFKQLEQGVTESGFWYEGSIHYNFFALEGIMNFFVFASAYGYPIEERYRKLVFHMFEAAYDYGFDNDRFPNPGDGWPNVGLKTYAHVYYMAYKVFGEPVIPYLKHIEAGKEVRTRLPLSEPYYYDNKIPLERLLFMPMLEELSQEPAPVRVSHSFEASNCATLRNEVFNVFLKYGHQTDSHAHPDKMNIEIMVNDQVLTKDLSNSGYASRMCNLWQRKGAAHNICIVNGQEPDISRQGHLISFSDYGIHASSEPYDGAVYSREITLDGGRLNDRFTVGLEQEAMIDWFFHFESPVDREAMILEATGELKEYELIQEVQKICSSDSCVLLKNDLVTMKLYLEPGVTAYLARTYNNPADRMRDTLILRKYGSRAVFAMELRALMSR